MALQSEDCDGTNISQLLKSKSFNQKCENDGFNPFKRNFKMTKIDEDDEPQEIKESSLISIALA